jgi:uncharacterized membrane protein
MKDVHHSAFVRWLHEHVAEREEKWRYDGGKRDLRLDLLRGFAAFAMITDHIGVRIRGFTRSRAATDSSCRLQRCMCSSLGP